MSSRANQTPTRAAGWARALPGLAAAAAGLFALAFLGLALARLAYPYDLDFVENGMLLQAWQAALGRPVFAAPTADFAPNVYMPLYTDLGGLLLRLTGLSYWPLRLLSTAATLGTAGLIGWIARRESGRPWLAVACAGLYLAGYRLTGFWFDLARVDALYTALALAGWTVGVYGGRSWRGQAAAAGLLALAFFTKQTGVLFAGGLAITLALASGRRAWLFPTLYALGTALPYALINAQSGGWFAFHTLGAASGDPVEIGRVAHYLFLELGGNFGALSALAVAAAWGVRRRAGGRGQPWLWGLAAAALVSGLGRASVGGNLNNLMPVYAFLCLAPALAAREWLNEPQPAGRRAPLLAAMLLLQLALGVYNPLRALPTAADRAAGDRLVARLRAMDGEVLVLMHPYYAVLAGKAPSVQIIHLWYYHQYRGWPWPEDFAARLRGRYYAAVISDESIFEGEPSLKALLEANYTAAEVLAPEEAPRTLSGLVVRPQIIYRPRPPE